MRSRIRARVDRRPPTARTSRDASLELPHLLVQFLAAPCRLRELALQLFSPGRHQGQLARRVALTLGRFKRLSGCRPAARPPTTIPATVVAVQIRSMLGPNNRHGVASALYLLKLGHLRTELAVLQPRRVQLRAQLQLRGGGCSRTRRHPSEAEKKRGGSTAPWTPG